MTELYQGVRMRIKARVGPKGQVVIPKELRDEFKILPGSEVSFDSTDEAILIFPSENPDKFVDEYVSVVKRKEKPPKKVDWDALYYSQLGE